MVRRKCFYPALSDFIHEHKRWKFRVAEMRKEINNYTSKADMTLYYKTVLHTANIRNTVTCNKLHHSLLMVSHTAWGGYTFKLPGHSMQMHSMLHDQHFDLIHTLQHIMQPYRKSFSDRPILSQFWSVHVSADSTSVQTHSNLCEGF